jgi:hypothetical protein
VTTPEQVRLNARACGCRLTADEVAEVSRITRSTIDVGKPVPVPTGPAPSDSKEAR